MILLTYLHNCLEVGIVGITTVIRYCIFGGEESKAGYLNFLSFPNPNPFSVIYKEVGVCGPGSLMKARILVFCHKLYNNFSCAVIIMQYPIHLCRALTLICHCFFILLLVFFFLFSFQEFKILKNKLSKGS